MNFMNIMMMDGWMPLCAQFKANILKATMDQRLMIVYLLLRVKSNKPNATEY